MRNIIGRVPFIQGRGMPSGYEIVTARELRNRSIEKVERRLSRAIAAGEIDKVLRLTRRLNELRFGI